MIITQQQKAGLEKHFRSIFKFRETFEEVYDHVLTAVADAPADACFEIVVNQTIAQDFGGYKALPKLESGRLSEMNRAAAKSAWRYFVGSFKPAVIAAACLYGMGIYYLLQYKFSSILLIVWLLLTVLFPYVLLNIWRFKSAYAAKEAKKSLLDVALVGTAMVPYQISFLGLFLFNNIKSSIIFKTVVIGGFHYSPVEISIIFTLSGLYCYSFYTWYKKGFKLKGA